MPLTAEQLAVHHENIGGSVAPIVAGLSPWESPLERYYIMRGELKPNVGETEKQKKAKKAGTMLEDVVASMYCDETGNRVRRSNLTLVDKEHPFIIAHVDRLVVGQRRGLECKTTRYAPADKWGPSGTDQVPEYYVCQCQHYMRVTGYEWWDLCALVGGNDPRVYHIPRDDEFIADLVKIEVDFMRRVREGDPPPAMSLDDVNLRWQRSTDKAVTGTDAIIGDVHALELVRAEARDCKEREDEIKLRIASHMGDAETLLDGDAPVLSYKDSFQRRVDTDVLKAEFPEVYSKVAVPSRSRKMIVLKGKAA